MPEKGPGVHGTQIALIVVHNLVHSPVLAGVVRISGHGGVILISKKSVSSAEPLCGRSSERSNMQLSIKPESAQLVWITDGDDAFPVIILDCIPDSTIAVLEIGDGHIFASKTSRSLFNRRQACDLRVRLRRKSTMKPESIKELNLSKFWQWCSLNLCTMDGEPRMSRENGPILRVRRKRRP